MGNWRTRYALCPEDTVAYGSLVSWSEPPNPPISIMKAKLVSLALAAVCMTAVQLHSQQHPTPVYHQSLAYVKTQQGKGNEYVQFARETTMKMAQLRADAGEIVSWTLLQSVYPAGQEARANYLISTIYEGAPRPAQARARVEENLKKAGVQLKIDEFYAKRDSLSSLVAMELWRPRNRVAAPQKGHYLFLNMMKVRDAAAYIEFEDKMWRPLAEEWVKQGAMSGWIFATKVLPAGTETPYSAYSADMFPTWEAAFAARSTQSAFEKVHKGKNYQEFAGSFQKLRDLARRELWVVVERVEKKK